MSRRKIDRRATNPSSRHFHFANLDDALRAGVVAMPLADAMVVKDLERHAEVSVFPFAADETLVLLYYPKHAPADARRDLEAAGFRGRPVAPSLGGGERFSKIYPTTRVRNPRYPAGMARVKRPLSEDPIGDKFDRLVEHLTPKHGVVTARRIAAVSLNTAYPGALAAARRKADAERRAGLRPPRKARGTARTPPTHAGDLRRGDLFTVGRGTTVYLAMAHAEPRRVKGKYVTAMWAAVGRAAPVRSRGPRPRTLLLGPATRVLVVKRVERVRNPSGRIDDGLVGRIIERNPASSSLGLWDDGLAAVRSFGV